MSNLDAFRKAGNPMFNDNKLKLGVFGSNCSNAAAVTLAETSFAPTWEKNLEIVDLLEASGFECIVPIARWRGFGGPSNFNGNALETYTWAAPRPPPPPAPGVVDTHPRPPTPTPKSAMIALGLMAASFFSSVLPAQSPPPAIVFLGDSLTAGYGLELGEAYPALIAKKVSAAGLRYEVVNAGVSGDTTSGGLSRLDWVLRRPNVAVFVLALGANDGLRGIPAEVTRRNLDAILARVHERQPAAKLVVAGMQLPPNYGPAFNAEFRAMFAAAARAQNATLIPFLLEGVGGIESLNQADRVHPTAEGQRRLAETVWRALEPLLRP